MADPSSWNARRIWLFLGLFLILVVLGINVFVHEQSKPFIFARPEITTSEPNTVTAKIPTADIAILLGASVFKNGELTPLLADRADTAIDLYKNGYVKRILVTGDNSTKYYNEVDPMRNYLLKQAVPSEDILVDNAGLDTFDSMYRAKNTFGVRSALVVSQQFHLFRAIYIARRLGIDAYGVSSDRRPYNLKNDLRELFATVKSVWEVER